MKNNFGLRFACRISRRSVRFSVNAVRSVRVYGAMVIRFCTCGTTACKSKRQSQNRSKPDKFTNHIIPR